MNGGLTAHTHCLRPLNLPFFSQVQLSRSKLSLKCPFQSILPLAMYTIITFKCIYAPITKHEIIFTCGKIILHTFFWSWLWHAEVPGSGIKPVPQQWPKPQQSQCWILNQLSHQGAPDGSNFFFFFFFCLCLFRATPTAHGGSQAMGSIGAVAASLRHSHSNSGSEPHLQPTPQLTATPDP